jgi:sialidase-1
LDLVRHRPGIGIQLKRGAHKGRLVIPCNHRATGDGPGTPSDGNSHVIFSDDGGVTWQIGGSPEPRLFNESQVVELSDGRVMINMRNSAPAAARTRPAAGRCDQHRRRRDLRAGAT